MAVIAHLSDFRLIQSMEDTAGLSLATILTADEKEPS